MAPDSRPLPLTALPPSDLDILVAALRTLAVYALPAGRDFLLKTEISTLVQSLLGLSEAQVESRFRDALLAQALHLYGFEPEESYLYHHLYPRISPPLASSDHYLTLFYRRFNFREAAVEADQLLRATFATGIPSVLVPKFLSDGTRLVYLEMVGPRDALKAHWAALQQRKPLLLQGVWLEHSGDAKRSTLKTRLPCGWAQWVVVDHQASLREQTPQRDCYVLDDGTQSIPALFFPLLAKSLRMPLCKEWTHYLWLEGFMADLIIPLNDTLNANGQYGIGGWRVSVAQAEESWERLVRTGLQAGHLTFPEPALPLTLPSVSAHRPPVPVTPVDQDALTSGLTHRTILDLI